MSDKIDSHLNIEEDYFSKDRKFEKRYKKAVTSKDRSKYKKTDQDKLNKRKETPPKKDSANSQRGRVIEITPDYIIVDSESKVYHCKLKGLLKKTKTKKKNLIAVGDFVLFEALDEKEGIIQFVEKRFSILSREDNLRRRKEQLIATNIDQVFITVSIFLPKIKPSLVDRYILSAKKGGMEPIIVLNKIDLLTSPPSYMTKDQIREEVDKYQEFKKAYSELGYQYLEVSAETLNGLDRLKAQMRSKASVFSGQSGVGKTSLINALFQTEYDTKKIIKKTSKGSHTTTSAKLIPIMKDGFCIDTPGIKSFGIWELSLQDLLKHFHEFHPFESECKYPNCKHLHEPKCGVLEALEAGKISHLRYKSYVDLVESIDKAKTH